MRLVTWNCNGKFREKFRAIALLDADLYVIQECENPVASSAEGYRVFAENHPWIGKNRSKGLGIFARPSLSLELLGWDTDGLDYFLPCRAAGIVDVVGVWAMKPYTRQYLDFQTRNYCRYGESSIVLGDFNSNARWDGTYSAGA